jgi:hypothetical protein
VTDGPLPDGPLPGQIPRLHFSPRRIARPSSPGNGGFSRLLRVGGVAALAMGGAAAAAMLIGAAPEKTTPAMVRRTTLICRGEPINPRVRPTWTSRPFFATTADRGLAAAQPIWPMRPPTGLERCPIRLDRATRI